MTGKRKLFTLLLAGIMVFLVAISAGCGQKQSGSSSSELNYPTKPVNMIIAFTAGGSSDVQARLMQKYWDKLVDQPWVFQYKPGAGGAIGFAEIARAKPDGYTIGGVNVPHIVLQPLGQNAQYSIDDFEYICQVVNDPQVLAVRKDSKFKSVKEVLDYAKENPGKLKVGIVGTFTGHHLMLLELQDKTGIKVTQVVYKGAADQNAALLGGEIDVMIGNVNDVMRSLEQMRILAVASEERSKFLPDVPTFKEEGIDIVSDIRRGFVVPKGTDPRVVQFLRDTFKKIAEDPEYLKDMEKAGQPAEYMSGEEFEKYVREQNEKARELLTKFGLLKS
ncbi:Tripartite-type tricarboxylate transporter, receptor component TctC [Desulfofundulus australicus DSM 11792]|uniref:Tripartite-type tricarboxylate transporter, receptor component TctC n=1 Tax=Desulfofundulus australicus DSM 11792 TaxID=1121425 RepID=A0A1M4SH50_9FIRM|nr:tripartite tricarboxylate transporter substrate binding protein [Desulfofundulus australicus]SHE31488.1 Tripartite-type tricarboxylate transporter, receptor component TctC [Desulfofundulus australicus DSM 11792]